MNTIINMEAINKSFHGTKVLFDVDFKVKEGEIHALCGENGAGKSTLMNILIGIHNMDSGTISFSGKKIEELNPRKAQQLGIIKIHQELKLFDNLTIADNIYIGNEPTSIPGFISERVQKNKARQALANLEELDVSRKVKSLSVAQKQLVEIARAFSYNSRVLIMDEPTASLTNKETDLLFEVMEKLKKQGVTIIYISHKLSEVQKICDRVTVLRDGKLVGTKRIEEIEEKDLARMMVGRDIRSTDQKSLDREHSEIVLSVSDLSTDILSNVSFDLWKGEILGFFGLVGAGRTELAEVLFGLGNKIGGKIEIKGEKVNLSSPIDAMKHGVGFLTEDRKESGLFLGRNIIENMSVINLLKESSQLIDYKKEKERTVKTTDLVNLRYSSLKQSVVSLSGGNQQKVALGKWLAAESDILILDEPTKGVDIGAKEEIYEIINELAHSGKSIILISSELPEILSIPHRILVMCEGEITGEMDCQEAEEDKCMLYATGLEKGESK